MQNLPKDLSKISNDPTANPTTRNLAAQLKNMNHNVFELPEIKRDQYERNKQISRSSMSLIE